MMQEAASIYTNAFKQAHLISVYLSSDLLSSFAIWIICIYQLLLLHLSWKSSLVQKDAAVKDTLLNGAVWHRPLAISIKLVLFEVSFLNGTVWKRSLPVALKLVVFELAFFDQAIGVNACSVTMHLSVPILAFDKARIRQMYANAV